MSSSEVSKPDRSQVWNLPNGLSMLRLLLVPVFGWLLLADGGENSGYRAAAAGVFLVASITDWLDGYLARRMNLITTVGKIVDPIADKALTGMALIGLSILGQLWWWVTILIIFRELGVTVLRFIVIRHGVIPASRGGKLKTVLQMVAILMYILPLSDSLTDASISVMAAAVIVTVVTGFDYVKRAMVLSRGPV
jgi:CDP-diacylglycerol---glycerol-3-phosphate 3-phosphatidyltransferase